MAYYRNLNEEIEALKVSRDYNNRIGYPACAEKDQQYIDWLEELKQLRSECKERGNKQC